MTLSHEDGQLYYRLWLPLLGFINRKYQVNCKLKCIAAAKVMNPVDVKAVVDKVLQE